MARAPMTFVATALLLLLVGGQAAEQTCESEACPAKGQALLQSRKSRWQGPVLQLNGDYTGHRRVLTPHKNKNGTWEIPQELLQHHTALHRSAGASASMTQAEKDEILDLHNFYRCIHDVPQMTWDEDIAANAQTYADLGTYGHSPSPRTVNGQNLGENIAWGWPSRTGISATTAWYDEIIYTDGTPESCDDKTNPNEDICHYTQVVWRASVKLGCGKGKASVEINNKMYNDGDWYVCQYGPAGNNGAASQFTANVLAPTQSEATCNAPTPPPTPPPPTPAPPTPAPAPPPPPLGETPASDCADMGREEGPLIQDGNGGLASCGDLASGPWMSFYCQNYGFVVTKCPLSCDPFVGSC